MVQDGGSDCQTTPPAELLLEALQALRPLERHWELRQDWDRDLRS
jgi:hypothetical protein